MKALVSLCFALAFAAPVAASKGLGPHIVVTPPTPAFGVTVDFA